MSGDDARWMRLALSLGARGAGRVWPNPAVGCVIVKGGRVLGRGWTAPGGRPHAETQAPGPAGGGCGGGAAPAAAGECDAVVGRVLRRPLPELCPCGR